MDGVFSLPGPARIDFLRFLTRSFHCAYICLWRYHHSNLSNRLIFLDGFYNVTSDQPSSSLGSSLAERLFNQYHCLTFDVNDDFVPGIAFKYHLPYLELQQFDLLRLSSTEIQTQFFQEARIKTAIFMGCNEGEFELGFSYTCQVDIQTALGNLFPEIFCLEQSQLFHQNPPSSSSSSLIPLSTSGNPEYSSQLFRNETFSALPTVPPTQTIIPYQQNIQALTQTVPSQKIPTPDSEHDAIVRAFIHVISSPSSSSTSHHHQNSPCTSWVHPEATAFKRYRPDYTIVPNRTSQFCRQSLMKRSFVFYRSLNLMRMRERVQAARSSNRTHLHHMISERRRREKLNENFQSLRALLPPRTKKDKASIIIAAKETMKALRGEIVKLNMRNDKLMKEFAIAEENKANSSKERLKVEVSNVPEPEASSSEERMMDLQVTLRGDSSQVDLLIRLLEFLNRIQNVTLISMNANTYITQGTTVNQLTFRLRSIEGNEWDESALLEAVRRVIADLIAIV